MINFESITSLNSYVRTSEMTKKWTDKKKTGDLTRHDDLTVSESWRQKKNAQDKLLLQGLVDEQNKEKDNQELASIRTKIANGEELTPEELDTLKEKDPVTYQSEIERRQSARAYEQKLSNAKTKEEFQRIRTEQVQSNFTRFNSVKNNSVIPDDAKLAVYQDINVRMKAEQRIETKFMESGEYAALPTEEERAETEKAAQEKLRGEDQNLKTKSEETEQTKKDDSVKESDKTGTDNGEGAKSDSVDESDSANKGKTNPSGQIHSSKKTDQIKTHESQKSYEADKLQAELGQKTEAELDEIRRKVERADQKRNKFTQEKSLQPVVSHIFTKG